MDMTKSLSLDAILPRLRCPATGAALEPDGDVLRSSGDRSLSYPIVNGVPDLRRTPPRLKIDVPWYEPWDELDTIPLDAPKPLRANGLPYHLDAHLAAIPGEIGNGRWILEIGCGERQCDGWFTPRGFNYVGTDVDVRGVGPHLLADAHNLPFDDGTFDLYCSMAVYEHLVSPITAALEGFRVLKPGGVFFGSAAFVYGFHDRASFHHMTHAGIYATLRSAGFEVTRMWADWRYPSSVASWGFRGMQGAPWRVTTRAFLEAMEWTFTRSSNLLRSVARKPRINMTERAIQCAGSVSFEARRPA
jgi:SAM-dependent methyltransferase